MTEFGLGVQSDKEIAEYEHIARRAEEGGFDVVTVFGDLTYQPPLPALMAMARVTERVRLGPSCLNPYSMAPYEIAGHIAGLDRVSHGRAFLGLSRGSWLERVGIRPFRAVEHIHECWEVVWRLLAGDSNGFEGSIFRLDGGVELAYPRLRSRIPLLVGTWGPSTARLAGIIADEVKIGGTANPAMVPLMRDRVGSADVNLVVGAVTVVDRDRREARDRARREAAMYIDVVARLDPTIAVPADLLDRIATSLGDGHLDEAARLIPDDLLDLFAFSGNPDDIVAQSSALIGAGADRIDFGTPHGLSPASGIDLLCTAVLPALR